MTQLSSADSAAEAEPKYWAFISYSHTDARWARWLQKRLEAISIPRSLVEKVSESLNQRRLAPVFRDTDELAASSDLSESIKRSLLISNYLIVVCSPQAAQSQWVNAEIDHFVGLGRAARILLFVVEGDPSDRESSSNPLPIALRDISNSHLWVDARPQGDLPERAAVRVAAGLLGVGFDTLWKRERRQRRRRIVTLVGAGTLAAVSILSLVYLLMRPTNLALCPVNKLNFKDPWLNTEVQITRSGQAYVYLCGDDIVEEGLRSSRSEDECTGPYGSLVLQGQIDSKPVYFVYETIKGSPCCGWNSYGDAEFKEIVSGPRFAWHSENASPLLGSLPFASIEFESWSITEGLGDLHSSNPLIASGCRTPFLSLGEWFQG